MFAGTDTISMFKEASFDKALSVVWPLKKHPRRVLLSGLVVTSTAGVSVTRYGLMMEINQFEEFSSSFE